MDNMRTIAMYLPQFHHVKENDEWWGTGFTEWTAVRGAKPLFDGHNQPERPLNDNYYDLLKKETMEWQTRLAKKYSIDGFAFYHYWFKDGRRILEKPAENLLKWKDIDMPFCFCWDACQWARTWTRLGNSWADKFEKQESVEVKSNGILLEQKFGDEQEWKDHFLYLLPFFRDSRYIKLDNKPVFIFYSSGYMPCFERMVNYWRKMAVEQGLAGLYIVAFNQPNRGADSVVLPMSFNQSVMGYNRANEQVIGNTTLRGYSYDRVWEDYLKHRQLKSQKTLWLCTVSFDDTPRRGLNGRIYLDATPNKFSKYFKRLVAKSREEKNPFLFIDAWNEWGEGKHLEPDVVHKFDFLEAVREAVELPNARLSEAKHSEDNERYIELLEDQIMRYQNGYFFLLSWLQTSKYSLERYFLDKGYRRIAIYGFGMHGHLLYKELLNSNVKVSYAIDLHGDEMKNREEIPVFGIQEELPRCDVVVVSIINDYNTVASVLKNKVSCSVISLYEVVSESINK